MTAIVGKLDGESHHQSPFENWLVYKVSKGGCGVKHLLLLFLLVSLSAVAISAGQVNRAPSQKHLMIATPEGKNLGLSATSIERRESAIHVIELKGNVEIQTRDMLLRADEASFNEKTAEIEARGAVRVKLETQK